MKRRLFIAGSVVVAGAAATGVYWRRSRRGEELQLPDLPPPQATTVLPHELEAAEYDCCVIGSGPAGAAVAEQLVMSGRRVVVLESGGWVTDPAAGRYAVAMDRYASVGEIAYPLQATRIRALGGTSNIWTGRCPRFLPTDFEPHALTPAGAPWPLGYSDLEPYYAKAERTLNVEGGRLSASHAPRNYDLPGEPSYPSEHVRAAIMPLGFDTDPPPISRSPALGGGQAVRTAYDAWPGITQSPSCVLVQGATVGRLRANAAGAVEAAEVFDAGGGQHEVRAARYVVACGAVETARLLLLSRSAEFPDGLGNGSGELGRNFMEHPFVDFEADIASLSKFEGGREMVRTYELCDDLHRDGFGAIVFQFDRRPALPETLRISCGIEMQPSPRNLVALSSSLRDPYGNSGAELNLDFTEKDRELLEKSAEMSAEMFAALDAGPMRRTGDISWSHHHMGTTRMGADPATSVVGPDLRVHGTSNAYVASSSVFVTAGVGNPTLTIVALAHRLAEHLLT